jgi:hypothetical protein
MKREIAMACCVAITLAGLPVSAAGQAASLLAQAPQPAAAEDGPPFQYYLLKKLQERHAREGRKLTRGAVCDGAKTELVGYEEGDRVTTMITSGLGNVYRHVTYYSNMSRHEYTLNQAPITVEQYWNGLERESPNYFKILKSGLFGPKTDDDCYFTSFR